jgi:prepilin-type processing-associated H-X9-DG protein
MSNVSMVDGHIDRLTHFDRINKMNVQELAEFICSIYDDNQQPYTADKNIEGYTIPDYDEDKIKQWLETEVEE